MMSNFNNKWINFNDDWEFALSEDLSFNSLLGKELDWKNVKLPHDFSISFDFDMNSPARNEGGLLNGGFGYYRKKFKLENLPVNKKILINFGGIYMDSDVYINGHFLGNYPFGYNEITYDITDFLTVGDNIIHVKVSHRQPSSRWYSGSGIFRPVELIVKNKLNILENEVIVTSEIDLKNQSNAKVKVTAKIENAFKKERSSEVNCEILSQNGEVIKESRREINIDALSKKEIEFNFEIENPKLWSIEEANLYYLRISLIKEEKLLDFEVIRFGLRKLDWDSEKGFFLNGMQTKLRGVCLHHDNGALGAVSDSEAERRKLTILKGMGVNAVRTSHNPQSRDFIALCDEIGILVIEEIFDTWSGKPKKEFDYNRFFKKMSTHPSSKGESLAEADVKSMVKRDRNSPSVFMWSMGNEIWETKEDYGLKLAESLIKWTKEEDKTRYVTLGENAFINGFEEGITAKIADLFDVVGLNYGEKSIGEIREKRPNWKIYGAETSSSLKSRGVYYNPAKKDNIATGSPDKKNRHFQMSDYGNDRVSWGRTAISSYIPDRDSEAYAGQFIWTGFDYIGEPTPWHNEENIGAKTKSSYFGIVDTAGFPKNDYYFYKSQWVSKKVAPFVKILPHWNFENRELLKLQGTDLKRDDKFIPVRVYSNLEKVSLKLNGIDLGEKSFNKKKTSFGREYLEGASEDELYLEWLVPFEKGKLEAFAYDGDLTAKDMVITSKEAKKIKLLEEYPSYIGKTSFLSFEIVDAEDNIVPYAENEVYFEIEGGEILGVDNGNAASFERYQAKENEMWKRKAFSGKGLLIFRADCEKVIVKATSKGLLGCIKEVKAIEKKKSVYECLRDKSIFIKESKLSNENDINAIKDKSFNLISIEKREVSSYENYRSNLPLYLIGVDEEGYEHQICVGDDNKELDKKLTGELTKEIGIHKIKGMYENLPFEIIYRNEEFVSAKNFSLAKVEGQEAALPKESYIYSTSGEKKTVGVKEWRRISEEEYEADLIDTSLKSKIRVREVLETVPSYNYALFWNGSVIPAAFASYSSDEDEADVQNINNGIIKLNKEDKDIWSNKAKTIRQEDFTGIIFARGGQLEKHSISYLRAVFYKEEDYEIPDEIVLEYFNKKDLSLPENYGNLEEESDMYKRENWSKIEAKKKIFDETIVYEFDNVNTLAIRLRFKNMRKPVAISEIEVFGKMPLCDEDERLEIKVMALENYKNKAEKINSESFKIEKDGKTYEVQIKPMGHGSYTVIEGAKENTLRVIAFDEKNTKETIYEIELEEDAYGN